MDDTKTKLEEWTEEYEARTDVMAAIAEACAAHGEDEIAVCELTKPKGEVVIFRTPKPADYQRFMSNIIGDNPVNKARAAEILARACVVHPRKDVFNGWLEKYPAIPTAVIKAITKLAGNELADRGKE